MEVIAEFSFNNGKKFIEKNHGAEFQEIRDVISSVDASRLKTKRSKEKTMVGRMLYSPKGLNSEFTRQFKNKGWNPVKIEVETFTLEIGEIHEGCGI